MKSSKSNAVIGAKKDKKGKCGTCTKSFTILVAFLCIILMFANADSCNHSAEASVVRYSGTYGTCSWEINDEGAI